MNVSILQDNYRIQNVENLLGWFLTCEELKCGFAQELELFLKLNDTKMAQFIIFKNVKICKTLIIIGAGGRVRTPNPQIRSLMLYPVELRPR